MAAQKNLEHVPQSSMHHRTVEVKAGSSSEDCDQIAENLVVVQTVEAKQNAGEE